MTTLNRQKCLCVSFGFFYSLQAMKCKRIRIGVFSQSLAILVHQKFVKMKAEHKSGSFYALFN